MYQELWIIITVLASASAGALGMWLIKHDEIKCLKQKSIENQTIYELEKEIKERRKIIERGIHTLRVCGEVYMPKSTYYMDISGYIRREYKGSYVKLSGNKETLKERIEKDKIVLYVALEKEN